MNEARAKTRPESSTSRALPPVEGDEPAALPVADAEDGGEVIDDPALALGGVPVIEAPPASVVW